MEKRGWITWFTWNTNHHLRRPQASFHSPEGEETLRPPQSDLRSLGKISRLGEYPRSRWEFSQKGKERTTRGKQSFQKLIRFLYFLGLLIYLLLHIGMNRELRRGQQSWPLSRSGASYKCITKKVLGVLNHLLAIRPADILWSFLSENQKTDFSKGVFS